MAVDNSFIVKKIIERPTLIVAYSAYTNVPYVVCDPESFNDQIFIFENETLLQAFAKEQTEKHMLLRGIKFENKNFLSFFSSLYLMGVNEVVLTEEDGVTNIELENLVRKPDYSKLEPKDRPLTNPTLVLTGMYFKQEVIRQQIMLAEAKKAEQPDPTTDEMKARIRELDEELAHDLSGSHYMVAVQVPEKKEGEEHLQYRFPILKMKNGDPMLPLFTDPMEFQKFVKQSKEIRALNVPFEALLAILPENVKGYILNPLGFNVVMPAKMIEGIAVRFGKKMQKTVQVRPDVHAANVSAPSDAEEHNDSKVTNFSDLAKNT